MKIPVIFIAAVVAAGGSRPPRFYDSDFRDSPPFFDGPPRSLYSKDDTFLRHHPRVFGNEFGDDAPPRFREGRVFFDSPPTSYFPPRRPNHFYQEQHPRFQEGLTISQLYIGPPPPAPSDDPKKSTIPTLDEHPAGTSRPQSAKVPTPTATTTVQRQPLSFGGHANHLSFGDHGLGFASVAGITASDINPLDIAEITSTTSAAGGGGSPTIGLQQQQHSTGSGVQVSAQQAATNPPSSEAPTSAAAASATPAPKIASSQAATQQSGNSASTLSYSESTTPTTATKPDSATPRSRLESVQHSPNRMPVVSMMVYESPRTPYDFRTVTQDFPPAAHGQLPIESSDQQQQQLHIPDIKQNLLIYEAKSGFPYHQSGHQIVQQQGNGAAPLRLTIPTAPVSTSLSTQAAVFPMKVALQNVNFSRQPIAYMTVPSSFASHSPGQNQINLMHILKLNNPVNSASQIPSYYFVQNNEQHKPAAQINAGIPLGSFYILPNQESKQPTQVNQGVSSGLQIQLGGLDGIEYLASSSNNEQVRPSVLNIGKVGANLQEQFQLPEAMFAKIGFGQNPW